MKILIALCFVAFVANSFALPLDKTQIQPQQFETLEIVEVPVNGDIAEFRRVRSPAPYGLGYGGYPSYGIGSGGYGIGYPGYGGGFGGGYYPGYGGGFGSAGASASASASAGSFGK